jgi:hypothetical protein
MENTTNTHPAGKSNKKSWTRTYVLVLVFNALLIVLFYFLSHYFNVQ